MKKIEEALLRGEDQDRIYIGEVAKRFYNGEAGHLFRAVLNGYISEEASRYEHDSITPADRSLGRIEAYEKVKLGFEIMISTAEELVKPIREEDEHEVEM